MIPLILDPDRVAVVLIGNGEALSRRLKALKRGGVVATAVFSPEPEAALARDAGDALHTRLPGAADLRTARVVFIAGLDTVEAGRMAQDARDAGALVHVEDARDQCDFHMPAIVRRGDLMIAVSTGGRCPGLARRLRGHLEGLFGPEWQGRIADLAARRAEWRARGDDPVAVARHTDNHIDARGWLT